MTVRAPGKGGETISLGPVHNFASLSSISILIDRDYFYCSAFSAVQPTPLAPPTHPFNQLIFLYSGCSPLRFESWSWGS